MTAVADLARDLRAEARTADERRLLVLVGEADATREAAVDALDAADVDPEQTTYVGTGELPYERIDPRRADRLLGTTREAVVLDWHDECRPNAVGRTVGTVDGGGLVVALAPPLADWPDRRDGFDESLAVPPFDESDVTGHFRERLVDLLYAHPGVAIIDVGDGDDATVRSDGLTDPAPRRPDPAPEPPADAAFPASVYERCLTGDQIEAVAALEALREPDRSVVVEADRGRGKSSAGGLAAAALALDGRDVLVTAPDYRNAAEVFARADEVLTDAGAVRERDDADEPRVLATGEGLIRFERPAAAADCVDPSADRDRPDAALVDEAAALPVRLLERFLAAPAVGFTTTVHGYEGAGRGFSVRFRDRLAESDHEVATVRMADPIRYAAGDPVEVWAFRALLLDARPAVDPLVTAATPETVAYRRLDAAALRADEHLLREAFGLLVLAHYRTEPNDLARLLDAPNVTVRALAHDGHVVSVALLAREGDLPADLRAHMYEGGRVRGNMIPDVLTSQLRDEGAAVPVGQRVMRIATHPAVRSRGLGSRLLSEIEAEFADDVDWLGTGYGATPELLDFWRTDGYRTVHLSTTRNESSGEHSAVMLRPTSEAGRDLHDRHARWFAERIGGMLSDPLADVDPDVIRATLRSVDARPPLDLSDWEWRLLAGLPHGAAIFDTSPRPLRRLAVRYLIEHGGSGTDGDPEEGDGPDGDSRPLTDDEERLLVAKALQARSWRAVTARLGFHSHAECMRALGRAVEPLLSRYGTAIVRDELERYE